MDFGTIELPPLMHFTLAKHRPKTRGLSIQLSGWIGS